MPCSPAPTDPATEAWRCPLCGADNRCAMQTSPAADAAQCWCMVTDIPAAVLARVPSALRGRACICARCARGEPAAQPH